MLLRFELEEPYPAPKVHACKGSMMFRDGRDGEQSTSARWVQPCLEYLVSMRRNGDGGRKGLLRLVPLQTMEYIVALTICTPKLRSERYR